MNSGLSPGLFKVENEIRFPIPAGIFTLIVIEGYGKHSNLLEFQLLNIHIICKLQREKAINW